jgi:hypothetical protein
VPGATSSCPFDPGDYEPRLGLFQSLLHYFVGWFTFWSFVDAVFGWYFLQCIDAYSYKWWIQCAGSVCYLVHCTDAYKWTRSDHSPTAWNWVMVLTDSWWLGWLCACVEIWLLLYAELKSLTHTRIRRRRRRKPPDPRRRLTGKMKKVMKTARFYEDCANYIRAWTSQLVSRLHLAFEKECGASRVGRLHIVVCVLNSTPLGLGIRCGKG